jgi:hypothetical protein
MNLDHADILAFSKIIYMCHSPRYSYRMLPNHYEVEEVARIRRGEAMQRVRQDRLRRAPDQPHAPHDDGGPAKAGWSTSAFGQLSRRLSAWFKRDTRLPTRSFSD